MFPDEPDNYTHFKINDLAAHHDTDMKKWNNFGLVWFGLVWFYGIATFVGYFTPNLFLSK